ncbi:glycosyltransferase family 4 protein [Psychroserpens luteus]|uniref:Glycosyltransferase family 4 protein n=1 Tax=Psychroserpens luteus TaxID=1434066 RepID=A0ABW5ZWQ0_9FLAO|nr:glycosyltransferase family 1 protein [Psychroserpens luteus]
MRVTYFFRKPYQDYFSIENVFKIVQQALPKEIVVNNYHLKFYSTGVITRLKSCFEVLRHQGDINHITGDIHYVSYFLPKKRTVLTIHDLAPLENSTGLKHAILKFFWYQLPIKSVAYVTVISNYTKKALLDIIDVNPDKIKVIHNPFAAQLTFQPKKEMPEVPVLLQIGTAYNKNLEGLIQAIGDLTVELVIIGKLSIEQITLLESASLNYSNAHDLEYDEVVAYYEKADLVCFASFYEGFGLPILEAQAIGRPVITSNRCAMPEVAGDSAILIDPLDIQAYRNAIKSVLSNSEERKALVDKGIINTQRFTASQIAEQYVELYKSLDNHV